MKYEISPFNQPTWLLCHVLLINDWYNDKIRIFTSARLSFLIFGRIKLFNGGWFLFEDSYAVGAVCDLISLFYFQNYIGVSDQIYDLAILPHTWSAGWNSMRPWALPSGQPKYYCGTTLVQLWYKFSTTILQLWYKAEIALAAAY